MAWFSVGKKEAPMGSRVQLLGEPWHCSLGITIWHMARHPWKWLSFAEALHSLNSWENKANAGRLDTSICWWWCKAPVMFLPCQIAHPPARWGIFRQPLTYHFEHKPVRSPKTQIIPSNPTVLLPFIFSDESHKQNISELVFPNSRICFDLGIIKLLYLTRHI